MSLVDLPGSYQYDNSSPSPPRWSSETPGMREVNCCLSLPPDYCLDRTNSKYGSFFPDDLPRQHVQQSQVEMDEPSYTFPGYRMMQGSFTGGSTVAIAGLVLGSCYYDRQDQELMTESLTGRGVSKWPGSRVLACPRCQKLPAPSSQPVPNQVLMLQFLYQKTELGIMSRIEPRMWCTSCFAQVAPPSLGLSSGGRHPMMSEGGYALHEEAREPLFPTMTDRLKVEWLASFLGGKSQVSEAALRYVPLPLSLSFCCLSSVLCARCSCLASLPLLLERSLSLSLSLLPLLPRFNL